MQIILYITFFIFLSSNLRTRSTSLKKIKIKPEPNNNNGNHNNNNEKPVANGSPPYRERRKLTPPPPASGMQSLPVADQSLACRRLVVSFVFRRVIAFSRYFFFYDRSRVFFCFFSSKRCFSHFGNAGARKTMPVDPDVARNSYRSIVVFAESPLGSNSR